VVCACDEHSDDITQSSLVTSDDLTSFVTRWYMTALRDMELEKDDLLILECHYTIMVLLIRSQKQLWTCATADLCDDSEGLRLLEHTPVTMESISRDSLLQQAGKKDLILPVIPVLLEAERLAPTTTLKKRVMALLKRVKGVESFWSTDVVADFFATNS